MRKRWQRINEGAQKFGVCYDDTRRNSGSGSNLDNINEKARETHLKRYKKKSNFEPHYFELRRQPKWRTPSSTNSSKRTKLSNSGAYSSSRNNDTPTNEDVQSPVRPKGTKTAKRNGKGKAKMVQSQEEWEELQVSTRRKLDLMEAINETKKKRN
ncbi:glutathione S-transferase T2-like [Apium graveolens]|uniref:glutathione S-transferase T2-like n=1 Tax=Apium graveolens TaxID=4045 RepID=UPI003D7B96F5